MAYRRGPLASLKPDDYSEIAGNSVQMADSYVEIYHSLTLRDVHRDLS